MSCVLKTPTVPLSFSKPLYFTLIMINPCSSSKIINDSCVDNTSLHSPISRDNYQGFLSVDRIRRCKCLEPENRTLDLCTKQNSVFAELINILRIRFHIQGHDALFQKLLRAPIKKCKFWPRGLCIANK